MSAALLNYPLKGNEVSDDIESFYHILTLFAMRFHEHDLSPAKLKEALEQYDNCEYVGEYCTGSKIKLLTVRSGQVPFALEDPALKSVLLALANVVKQHYDSLDEEEMKKFKVGPERLVRDVAEQSNADRGTSGTEAAEQTSDSDYELPEDLEQEIDPSALPQPPTIATPARTLDDHTQFSKVFTTAWKTADWSKSSPKTNDQFRSIDWNVAGSLGITGTNGTKGTGTGSKRTRTATLQQEEADEAKPGPSKKSKTAADGGSTTVVRRTTRSQTKATRSKTSASGGSASTLRR